MYLLKTVTLHQIILFLLHHSPPTHAVKLKKHPPITSINNNLTFDLFPIRFTNEAAVVEWGNSAIISALDAAVASFGPQTSRGAFFEVETAPILANPLNAVRSPAGPEYPNRPMVDADSAVPYPGPLVNSEEVEGNMVVMTNDNGLSGVAMARVAKESGAAALMVVNLDEDAPDYIYSLRPESDEERVWAEENIDIPIIMVSLGSGNLITTATVEEGMDEKDIVNDGMPDRVRLYGAGDRPFFEDVSHEKPVLYLIHNLLTSEECDMLVTSTQGKGRMEPMDDGTVNLLEKTMRSDMAVRVEGMMLWKGQMNGHAGKQIEERIEQVTGYPSNHFSDWQLTRYADDARHEVDYDRHPIYDPVATITVFLTEGSKVGDEATDDDGGAIIYPQVKDIPPIKILPQRGMAVVHHNLFLDESGNYDPASLHGHLPTSEGSIQYIAKKYVYGAPLPISRRIVLPVLAALTGGKLPRWVRVVHDAIINKFGQENGTLYFEKLCTVGPMILLFLLANITWIVFRTKIYGGSNSSNSSAQPSGTGEEKRKKKKKKKAPLKSD